jgi:transposase-like protein
MAVQRVREGERPSVVIASYGFNRPVIYRWLRQARGGGRGLRTLRSRKATARPRRQQPNSQQERSTASRLCSRRKRTRQTSFALPSSASLNVASARARGLSAASGRNKHYGELPRGLHAPAHQPLNRGMVSIGLPDGAIREVGLVPHRRFRIGRVGRVRLHPTNEIERSVECLVVLRIWGDIGLRTGLLGSFRLEMPAQ